VAEFDEARTEEYVTVGATKEEGLYLGYSYGRRGARRQEGASQNTDVGEGTLWSGGQRGSRQNCEEGGENRAADTEDEDCHTRGYQTRIPSIPKGTGAYEVEAHGSEGVGVHDHGQGTPAAVALGNWKV